MIHGAPSISLKHASGIGLKMPSNRAILVIAPSWIGDIVMAQSLFLSLARDEPGVSIDVVAPGVSRPLISRMREVRNFIPSPFSHGELALGNRAAFGRQLIGQYSQAYVLPGSWKSAVVPYFAAVPRRCGYLREWRWGLLNDVRQLPRHLKRSTARAYQGLADPAVLEDAARLLRPSLRIDQLNQQRLLRSLSLARDGYACLAPGAEYGPAKRWPSRHWSGLADRFAAQGLQAVVLGSAREQLLAEAICSKSNSAINLAGKTDLADVVDLAAGCRIVVANDSGLMHVAAAAGRPVVALYGSTSPEDTPPLSASARSLFLGLSCSPCRKRVCPLGHHDCLEKLTIDRVMDAARALAVV